MFAKSDVEFFKCSGCKSQICLKVLWSNFLFIYHSWGQIWNISYVVKTAIVSWYLCSKLSKMLSILLRDTSEFAPCSWADPRIVRIGTGPPFWQINHANSAYFRLFLGYFRVISVTRPPFWISAPFLHILDPPLHARAPSRTEVVETCVSTLHVARLMPSNLKYKTLMQPSKTTLNLPSSSLHLCSPLKEIRRVKIHHQFTSFPK